MGDPGADPGFPEDGGGGRRVLSNTGSYGKGPKSTNAPPPIFSKAGKATVFIRAQKGHLRAQKGHSGVQGGGDSTPNPPYNFLKIPQGHACL